METIHELLQIEILDTFVSEIHEFQPTERDNTRNWRMYADSSFSNSF